MLEEGVMCPTHDFVHCWNKIEFVQCLWNFDDNKVMKNNWICANICLSVQGPYIKIYQGLNI